MQSEGFRLNDIVDRPVIVVPQLFAGAFKAHHRKVKPDTVENLFKETTDKEKLLELLIEMYNDAESALMEEPDEDAAKNVSWGVTE